MKMILFRPTFVSAATMLQYVALLCILFASGNAPLPLFLPSPPLNTSLVAQAAPQFGLPFMHALDESQAGIEPVPSGTVDPPAAVMDPAATPVVDVGDAAPTVDPTVAINAAVSSTSVRTTIEPSYHARSRSLSSRRPSPCLRRPLPPLPRRRRPRRVARHTRSIWVAFIPHSC